MGRLLSYTPVPERAEDLSDEALIAACGTGDAAALTLLFRRYNQTVDRFLARFAGVDDRDLDDLVQATFIAINRSARRFRGKSAVKTWILGIATNVARKHIRTEVRRRSVRTNLQAMPTERTARPDDVAAQRQALARLEHGIALLPDELRAVFVLCVLEGVSGKEAAKILRIREGTLWRRLHEARTALREAVEQRSS